MSNVSSLSLWSSLKIPFCSYPKAYKRDEKSSVPFVDTVEHVKRENNVKKPQLAKYMVNLRVPVSKEKENFCPPVVCPSYVNRKENKANQTHFNKEEKKIKFVKVPDKILFSSDNEKGDLGEVPKSKRFDKKSNPTKPIHNYGDTNERFMKENFMSFENYNYEYNADLEYEGEDEDEDDWIPSIKPWTLEELEKINKKYMKMEHRIKTLEFKKKKRKKLNENILMEKSRGKDLKPTNKILGTNKHRLFKSPRQKLNYTDADFDLNDFYHDYCDSDSESDLFRDQDVSRYNYRNSALSAVPRVRPSEERYYQSKLAKLYLIELGFKI